MTSLSSSSHLPAIEASRLTRPVALPPGRDRLATKPWPTGSTMFVNTIGVVPGPAKLKLDILALRPAELPQCFPKRGEPSMNFRVAFIPRHQHPDAPHATDRLLRARGERPKN